MGRNLVGLAVLVSAVITACGGPLDSPDPPVMRDAGVDTRAASGGRRVIGGSGGITGGFGGSRVVPDAGMADQGAAWPVVTGCVTGRPPRPSFQLQTGGQLPMGCVGAPRRFGSLTDLVSQGFIFSARIDVRGLSVTPGGTLCGNGAPAPIDISVMPGIGPETRIETFVHIILQGPDPTPIAPLPVSVLVQYTDFSVDSGPVLDFGIIPIGTTTTRPLSVTNSPTGAPLWALYASTMDTGTFSLTIPPVSSLPSDAVPPGYPAVFFLARARPLVPGITQARVVLSPFPPGVAVDNLCGAQHPIILQVQGAATPP